MPILTRSPPPSCQGWNPVLPTIGAGDLSMADVVLSLLAHPDDAEFLCAGTLCRLGRECGWQLHIATMTPGDCGSAELDPEAIAAIRRVEATRAAALMGATYHCLEEHDLLLFYGERPLERATCLLRQ